MSNNGPYVIIGAGPAGVVAADTIRKKDANADVILIGQEPEKPYSRMAIPYVLTGGITESGTYLRENDDHYDEQKIRLVYGRVTEVDAQAKTVSIDGGDTISYGKLLIATGAHPIKPPVPGLDLPGVHHCWTLADQRKIIERANKGAKVVLMGAGFIGSIILEALARRDVNLTVVELENRMVPRMMNDTAGNMLKRWCETKGVRVLTSTGVTGVNENSGSDGSLAISLSNGETITADLLVVATGVKANTDFLKSSQIEVDDGIHGVVVDDQLKSNNDDVFAAGDCAMGPVLGGGWAVHAIQPTSVDHGRVAAINMTGGDMTYQGSLSMNVLDTLGLVSASFGRWDGVGADVAESIDNDNFKYLRLCFDGDKLVGALSIGRTEHIGVIRGLIQNATPLGDWKNKLKTDPHLIMDAYVSSAYF